jgi:hypothetical protein
MSELEDKLRKALCRQPAPEGLAEKVVACIGKLPHPGGKPQWGFRALFASPIFRWAAAVVACLLIAGGVAHYERQQRLRRQGEMAKVQVMQALRIASAKLNVARRKIQNIGSEAPSSHL